MKAFFEKKSVLPKFLKNQKKPCAKIFFQENTPDRKSLKRCKVSFPISQNSQLGAFFPVESGGSPAVSPGTPVVLVTGNLTVNTGQAQLFAPNFVQNIYSNTPPIKPCKQIRTVNDEALGIYPESRLRLDFSFLKVAFFSRFEIPSRHYYVAVTGSDKRGTASKGRLVLHNLQENTYRLLSLAETSWLLIFCFPVYFYQNNQEIVQIFVTFFVFASLLF